MHTVQRRALRTVLVILLAGIVAGTYGFAATRPSDADVAGAGAAEPAPSPALAHADFVREGSAAALADATSATVIATVEAVAVGPDLEPAYPKGATTPRQAGVPTPQALSTTDVRLRVDEVLRGDVPSEIVWSHVSAPGRVEIADSPTPIAGERYLLFLTRHDRFRDRWAVPRVDGRIWLKGEQARPAIDDGAAGTQIATAYESGGSDSVKEAIR